MENFAMIVVFIALLAGIVFLVRGIVAALRKKENAKKNFMYMGISLAVMIISFVIFAVSSETEDAGETTKQMEPAKKELSAEERAKKEADEKAAAEAKAQKEAEEKAKAEAAKSPKEKLFDSLKVLLDSKQAFDTGSYVKGDIPAGEYAFVSFEGSGKYYVEKDSADNIIDNESFDSFGYVYVHGRGNIETQGLLVKTTSLPKLNVSGAKQLYEILNDTSNFKDAGYYKIGMDLPAGKYVIESLGEGYMAKMSGPVGKSDIIDNEMFNGRYSVTVSKGQYLNISNAFLAE